MTRRAAEERMLDAMIEAARNEPLVELDVARLEADLSTKWLSRRTSKAPRSAAWSWAPAVVVVASLFATGLLVRWHRADTGRPNGGNTSVQDLVGTNMPPGQSIAADDRAVSVVHPQVARWTLAPHGKARIAAQGPYLTVSLLEGRIDADVIPSRLPESFAIETKTRRIAVHGTRFSVEQLPDAIVVEVLAGSVMVGALGQPGHTAGTLLAAPQKLRFALREAAANTLVERAAEDTDNPTPHRPKMNTVVQPPVNVGANHLELDHERQPLPQAPSPLEQETALDVVRAAAARCFAQAKTNEDGRESNVTVRVETHLTITIAPGGFLQNADFSRQFQMRSWNAHVTRLQRGPQRKRSEEPRPVAPLS